MKSNLNNFKSRVSKIDWLKKFSSRKFWLALAGFIVACILLFSGNTEVADRISAVIIAFGSIVGYLLAEGMSDAARGRQEDEEPLEIDPTTLIEIAKAKAENDAEITPDEIGDDGITLDGEE